MSLPTMLDQEREAFLAAPHVGVLSVASGSDRPPLMAPVWYHYEPGGNLTFFTSTQGQKARKTRLIRQAGVISFCVQREAYPHQYVSIEGALKSIDQPPTAEQMLQIVRRYLPEEQAQQFVDAEINYSPSELTLFTIEPTRWISVDMEKFGE